MNEKQFKRAVAILLSLCMCLSCLPAAVFAEEGEKETQSWTETEEQPLEDASAQLGEYTPPAADSEQEAEPPAEEPAAEPEAPAETTEAPRTEEPEAEPEQAPAAAVSPSAPVRGNMPNEGRTSADQQVLTLDDGTEFILIGTKQQLTQGLDYYPTSLANMTDSVAEENRPVVMGPIWRVHYQRTGVLDSDWRKVGEELVYPGDNNLRSDVTYKYGSGTKTGDFSSYSLYGMESEGIKDGNGTGWKIGQTQELDWFSSLIGGGSKDEWRYVGGTLLGGPDESIDSYGYGRYSQRNNYVVFRNIKLNEDNDTTPNWDPLMFYGLMYGVNGSALTDKTLEDAVREIRASDDASDYTYHEVNNTAGFVKPKISNVYVVTSTENRMLDQNKYVGVGFFATVTSSRPGASNGLTHIKAEVRNLELDNVHITNNYEGIHVDETVLSGLLSLAGTGVGYLLDGLLRVLTGKDLTGFHDSLNDLLTARAKDKTNLATGSFAGRVYGDVLIENCDVVTATVTSNKSYVGGFVGYSVGEEQYDGLSNTLNSLLKLLTTVLNVVPGLGLGDLISVVRNLLPVNTLIPVDYYNPRFESCKLTDLSGDIGPSALTWTFVVEGLPNETADAEFNGGFIGCKVATVMINCGVEDSDYTVYAKNYGGGFAGIARDAVIQELLSDLGIKFESAITRLMDAGVDLQSVQVHCYIKDSTVEVNGENYLGGFNGAMTFAYSVNNEMKSKGETLTVNGTGDCIGGYTGSATLGWAMSMGERESAGTTSLLETVKNLVGSLVENYGSELLNLSGVGQSEILGLQFDYAQAKVNGSYVGGEASVTGHDYVGGLVGKADALIMTGTTAESLQRTTYFEHGDLSVHDIFPNLDQDTEFTVTLYEYGSVTSNPNNSDYIVTDDENYLYTIPAPNNASPNNYTFVGWTTEHYDHTVNKPEKIYAVGDSVLITHDTTFNALYAKEGDPVFELITRTPENWETAYPSYIITYGCKESEMMVLTGLNDNVNYEDSNSGGATDLATIRNGDTTVFAFLNTFQITNVPDLYRFTANQVARTNDFYFQNIGKQTYLRRDLNGAVYRLEASSNNLLAGTQWHPSIGSELNVLFENDLLSLTNNKDKIVYNNTKNYFCMGTTEDANTEAKKIYIWGETKLPTKYTTVADGADIPSVSTTVELDESLVQEYASVNVYGLRQVNGHKFVGGIAGLAGTASVGGLLNDTIGIGDFKKFEFNDINVVGGTVYTRDAETDEARTGNDGLRVLGRVPNGTNDNGAGYYVGGGVGMAVGGDLHNIDLSWLNQVEGVNCVGGFIGCAGPGDLVGTGGLNLQLLGLSLLTANNLLAVGQGIVTDPRHCTVTGVSDGYTVEATGENDLNEVIIYCAGGFFGRSNSTTADDCHAKRILWVKANNDDGRAGGFIGVSQVGGLASMSDAQGTQIASLITKDGNGLVSASNLINAIGYLIPTYTKVDASYVDGGYVEAAWAGGFAADFQSGTVNNLSKDPLDTNQHPESKTDPDWYAVYNIDHVTGTLYAGGFGAKVYSGALAESDGGISVLGKIDGLSINITDLMNVISAYVPKIEYAGVKSDRSTRTDKTTGYIGAYNESLAPSCQQGGFTVTCTGYDADDKTTGAAGGFIGYGSGVQVTYSNVTQLLHTDVIPPEDLDGTDGTSYFGNDSAYAVTGTRYAGGYAGFLDISSSASLGGGLSILGDAINATNVLHALNCVISTVEHSDVYGGPGGFSVLATEAPEIEENPGYVGRAGGFVGWMRGAHIQDSNSWNFSYIIGRIAAGGYAGEIEPGSLADAVGDTTVLGGLASVSGGLLSVAQDFIPTIRNSVTTCIPCGGAVRADAESDAETLRGMAGGFVGHNCGGQILGYSDKEWKNENNQVGNNEYHYNGPQSECAAIRILSVYGSEYAGGFTGLMDAGSTADLGNISLLYDLVKLDNLLSALKVSYPMEENTAVYGPLSAPKVGKANVAQFPQVESLSYTTWNSWIDYVGVYGGYGLSLSHVNSQAEMESAIGNYTYGYHVTAGRSVYVNATNLVGSGCAGGYVGAMISGTITNGQAWNAKQVVAMRSAGGFAGEMKTGSVMSLGGINDLNLGQLLTGALDVFVPVVKTSSVHGYQSGLTVTAVGNQINGCGVAGGYAGSARGAQIWGDDTDSDNPNDGCNVYNLKKVQGTRYVGGYIGILTSGTAAEVGTNVSDGPLQDLLDAVVKSGSDNVSSLLSLASATVSTVRKVTITVADPAWGFTVGGWTDESDPSAPVRHVPLTAGGFVGTMEGAIVGNNKDKNLTTTNIQINDLRGVEAQYYAGGFVGVANEGSAASVAPNKTNVLSLANLGNISVLDIFRPYIYNADVNGVDEGFAVFTSGEESSGTMNSTRYSGCAGGFGGAVLDGHVQNSKVTKLSRVEGLNYVGGFIGHCGKGGIVDADAASLGDTARLLNAQAGIGNVIGSRVVSSSVTGISNGYTVQATGGSEPVAGGFVGFADLAKIGFKPATLTDPEQTLPCTAVNLKLVKSDQFAGGFIGKTNKGFLVDVQASSVLLEGLLTLIRYLLKLLYVPELQQGDGLNINILGNVLSISLLDDGVLGVTLLGIPIKVSLALSNTEGQSDVAKITIGDSYIELPCHYDEATGEAVIDSENPNLNIGLIPAFYTTVKNSSVTGISEGYDVFAGGADQEKDGTHRSGFAGGFVGYNQLGEISGCAVNACDTVRGTPADIGEAAQKVGPFTGFYTDESNWNSNGQAEKETNDTYEYDGSDQTHSSADNNASAVQTAPFESTAKLVLMEDTFLPANLQTMVPETADMQNPCLNRVDLTLHKVWDDMDGTLGQRRDADAEHPVTVTFTVKRVSKDASGAVIANSETTVQTVSLTAADENPFTKNVWTKKLTGLPATATENGSTVYYAYTVTEAAMSGYVAGTAYADADVTDKLTFDQTIESGYVAKLTNQAPAEQTVVVDFGLPVRISVLDYLKAKYEYPVSGMQVAGILPVNSLQNVSLYSTQNDGNEMIADELDLNPDSQGNPTPAAPATENRVAKYGTFELPALGEGEAVLTKLRYVPGSMMFDKPVDIAVALRGTDGAYYYTKVKIVPATTIYYEEDFIKFSEGWSDAGTAETVEQGEDRPGADVLDLNNIYGYDDRYSNGNTYSLGSAKKVTVKKGDKPTATFTFTGTGFDLLSVTDKTTGYMLVELYEGDTIEENEQPFARWAVDTFYGCTRDEKGYIRYLCVWDEAAKLWRIAKTAYPEMKDEEAAQKIGTTEDGCTVLADYRTDMATNHTSFLVYKKHYEWTTNESNSTIYQVPVISSRGYLRDGAPLAYGTYTVVLKPQYAAFFDHDKTDASYTLYVDGVRIYGPAENLDEAYYLQDHEGWPQFLEMRKLLLAQSSFGQTNAGSIVYIDGGIVVRDLSDFEQYGPNNEIYLDPGQAVAFTLKKGASAQVDQIHVSMKRIFAGEGKITFTSGTEAEPRSATLTLNTASECYYDLSSVIQWNENNETGLIVISNSGESGTISLRNLKVTYLEEVETEDDLVAVSVGAPSLATNALRLLRRSEALPIVLDEAPAFYGASVSLESDFSLHFYLPEALFENKTNPYVLFTKETEEGTVTVSQFDFVEELVGETLCRRYTFRNLSASEMGTAVTARLFYNGEGEDHMSSALTYSVKQYAMNMLEQTEDDALRTLLVDMLNYGAEAQKYFGVNVEQLANAELSEAQRAYATAAEPTLENQKAWISEKSAKVWFDGCSLSLERNVAINYYLDLSACGLPSRELILELTWKETDGSQHTTVIDGASFEARQFGDKTRYVAVLDELNAAQMRTEVSAVVRKKTNQSCISDTMRYSIVAYAQSKGTKEPALRTLLLAMMKYGDAAEAYFRVH